MGENEGMNDIWDGGMSERDKEGDGERVKDKLQALVYDILPLEESAGKRCSECE